LGLAFVKFEGDWESPIGWRVNPNDSTSNFVARLWVNRFESLPHGHSEGSVQQAAVGVYDLGKRLRAHTISTGRLCGKEDSDLE